jgi:hypothetical protein
MVKKNKCLRLHFSHIERASFFLSFRGHYGGISPLGPLTSLHVEKKQKSTALGKPPCFTQKPSLHMNKTCFCQPCKPRNQQTNDTRKWHVATDGWANDRGQPPKTTKPHGLNTQPKNHTPWFVLPKQQQPWSGRCQHCDTGGGHGLRSRVDLSTNMRVTSSP